MSKSKVEAVVDALSLQVLKARLGGSLGSLIQHLMQQLATLPVAGWLETNDP